MKTPEKGTGRIIRKEAGHIGWGLIIYSILSFMVVMFSFIIAEVYLFVNYPEITPQDPIYLQVMAQCENSGTSSIIGVCLGTLFLCFFFRKTVTFSTIMQEGKPMNVISFLQILGIFLGSQTFFTLSDILLESGLNLIGYSAMKSMETATSVSSTISMFLYASLVGPIIEELIYRGFVLRSLQKHGKLLAIVISAILFGVMHGNLPQSIFAFGIGIVLGYVAIEYSLKWAILLHIINNCIFSDVFGWLLSMLNQQTQDIISTVSFVVFGIISVILLIKKRNTIKEFVKINRTQKGIYCHILTAVGMIIFIASETMIAIVMLEKL